LEELLKEREKKFILTCGLTTSMCVLLTTTSSFQRGYLTALVDDCCADFKDAHEICLRRFEGFFDTISYKYLEDYHPKWNYQMSQLKYLKKVWEKCFVAGNSLWEKNCQNCLSLCNYFYINGEKE